MIWLSRLRTVSRATPTIIRIEVPPSEMFAWVIIEKTIGKIAIMPRKTAPRRVILEMTFEK